jgi:predicted acylesterase/phospholipase RssA
MTIIKHIVFTGGGPVGMVEYGALKYLTEKKFIAHENIESLYSISIGGIIGLIYILNYEWAWMDDFLIKRPWNKLVNISYSSYINILYEKGIINKSILVNVLEPLFLAKNIPLNITLLEFYNLTKIEFNIFACSLNDIKQIKFNHITNPNLELVDALYMSLSIPIIFVPLYIDNCFYLDGAIIVGCPINQCIAEKKCSHDEILCFMNDKMQPIDLSNNFYNKYSDNKANNIITNDSNFFEYVFFLIKKLFLKISNFENEIIIYIKNSINTALTYNSIDSAYWYHVLSDETERAYLINLGVLQAEKFLDKLANIDKLDNNLDNKLEGNNDLLLTSSNNDPFDNIEPLFNSFT